MNEDDLERLERVADELAWQRDRDRLHDLLDEWDRLGNHNTT